MGKFFCTVYEFESASSAKELQPTEQLFHFQTAYHFAREIEALDELVLAVLGTSLPELPAFR